MSGTGELRVRIPRSIEAVELFCQQFRLWYAETCYAPGAFAAELLLREALANGVAHSGNTDNTVVCVLRGGQKRLLIAVRDGGRGFDWRAAKLLSVEENCGSSGRGIAIYRQYANRVRFNESGNGITLVRFFKVEPKGERNDYK